MGSLSPRPPTVLRHVNATVRGMRALTVEECDDVVEEMAYVWGSGVGTVGGVWGQYWNPLCGGIHILGCGCPLFSCPQLLAMLD